MTQGSSLYSASLFDELVNQARINHFFLRTAVKRDIRTCFVNASNKFRCDRVATSFQAKVTRLIMKIRRKLRTDGMMVVVCTMGVMYKLFCLSTADLEAHTRKECARTFRPTMACHT